jgi:NAD-dependent SIR2 family protein deacetylase
MKNEELFKLIAVEDVVLFVGAGFSLYAGYPNGCDLAKTIYSKLSAEDKESISETDNLSELTDTIYHLKNQNNEFLIECLKDIFEKEPSSYHVHKSLIEIPHFKNIITTNYDKLFEYGFKHEKKFQIIKYSKDIPTIKNDHIKLYKIHGDLDNPEDIVLKKSDYENYFSDNTEESIFWNSIKDLLAKHHVLFIGYSLQDININVIFDKISKELKESRKKAFFASPSIDKVGKNRLSAMNIEFIQSTGEETLNALSDYLNESYFPSLWEDGGNTNTALEYGVKNNISLSINQNENGNLDFDSIKPLNKEVPLELNLKFSLEKTSKKQSEFQSFLKGEQSELLIKPNNLFKAGIFANGIKLRDDIVAIKALKPPFFNDKITFEFDDGYESSEFNLKGSSLNKADGTVDIKIEFLDYEFIVSNLKNGINKPTPQVTIKASPIRPISNVRNGTDLFEVFYRILNSVPFKAYSDDKLKYSNKGVKIPPSEGTHKIAELLEYFKNLKIIERAFNIKFSQIDLNEANFQQVNHAIAFIDKKVLPTKQKDLVMEGKHCHEFILLMDKYKEKEISFKRVENIEVEYSLHQKTINIGHPVYIIPDVKIIQDSFDENGLTDRIIITNTNEKAYISFQKGIEPHPGLFLLDEE